MISSLNGHRAATSTVLLAVSDKPFSTRRIKELDKVVGQRSWCGVPLWVVRVPHLFELYLQLSIWVYNQVRNLQAGHSSWLLDGTSAGST